MLLNPYNNFREKKIQMFGIFKEKHGQIFPVILDTIAYEKKHPRSQEYCGNFKQYEKKHAYLLNNSLFFQPLIY